MAYNVGQPRNQDVQPPELFRKSKLTDITLLVEGQELHFAKYPLMEGSDIFTRMIENSTDQSRLLVHDVSYKDMVIFLECLHPKKFQPITEAVGAIHILAFEKENHRKILDDTKIIDLLIGIKDNSPDKVARKTVDGIFWNLREELQKNHYKQIVSTGTPVNDRRGHIMISYNWQHQKEVIKIRDILKEHGFSVWVDIDNMGGSVVDAFSKAVEDAHVILMCMSQKYKDSANCKSDVEYAYWLKKTIIPLKMESGYNPNGWLGYIAGIKLFFDFSGKYPFEEKIKELIHEIAICYGDEEP